MHTRFNRFGEGRNGNAKRNSRKRKLAKKTEMRIYHSATYHIPHNNPTKDKA